MTDNGDAPEGKAPFEEHPLYQTAMKRLARGDVADAAAKFDRLVELYPEEQHLQDQAVRLQLMVALGNGREVPVERAEPPRVLRTILVLLLAIAIVTAGVALFAWAYKVKVRDPADARATTVARDSTLRDGMILLERGDAQRALERCQKVLAEVPAQPTAQACIEQAQQQKELDQLCIQAQSAEQGGDLPSALDLYHRITDRRPGYCNAPARIKAIETKQALDTTWQGAQAATQAENWQDAVAQLLQIRKQNIEYNRSEVEGLLFQSYTQLANQQLRQANGDLTVLNQALYYLNQALALRPTDPTLLRERELALKFVSGFEAGARGDWAAAVADWEWVVATQPDYQGSVLRAPLQDAYPKAAEQLIAGAHGNAAVLRQAREYLDKAIAGQPDNQALVQQRQLVDAYLAGSDAAAEERWTDVINYWGAIYAAYPDYQQGALEERLREVCTNHPEATSELCPP